MKIKNRILPAIAGIVALATMIGNTEKVNAGWTGSVLGTGVGYAYVNVTSVSNNVKAAKGSSSTGTTTTLAVPASAWIAATPPVVLDPTIVTNRWATNAPLPTNASANTIARAKGLGGLLWDNYTVGSNGDKTDNYELQQRVNIKPSYCPSLQMNSELTPGSFVPETGSGSITVRTYGTAGTALWLRGFEVPPNTVIPEDDISTPNNETTDWLKANSDLRFEVLLIGPFEYGYNGKCELIIPFTLEGGTIDNLAFVTDGAALSEPLKVNCTVPPQSVICGQPYNYPAVTATGGCGALTYSFSPDVEDLVVGPNTVTVTATDEMGDKGTCTFTVNVIDNTAPVPNLATLPTITGQCSAAITSVPTALDACSGTITGTTTNPLVYNAQGTFTVTWKFDDGHGNISEQTQTVIVQDTIAPVAPVLPDVYGSLCSPVTLTAPKATDNCVGQVTGTTPTTFPISTVGTHTVVWTFNDGRGNTSTANQKVVISGLTFVGFYAPLAAPNGGTCLIPAKVVKLGSVVPIKFDLKCGSTLLTSGPGPKVKVQRYEGCTPSELVLDVNAAYQNVWHANWDTSAPGLAKGIYKIFVELPDGSTPFVFVNLK